MCDLARRMTGRWAVGRAWAGRPRRIDRPECAGLPFIGGTPFPTKKEYRKEHDFVATSKDSRAHAIELFDMLWWVNVRQLVLVDAVVPLEGRRRCAVGAGL